MTTNPTRGRGPVGPTNLPIHRLQGESETEYSYRLLCRIRALESLVANLVDAYGVSGGETAVERLQEELNLTSTQARIAIESTAAVAANDDWNYEEPGR